MRTATQQERERHRKRQRLYGWWYVIIAAAFAVMAVLYMMWGDPPWLVALQFVVAAGFGFLGYIQLKATRPR
jgi:fatty acid desaturase